MRNLVLSTWGIRFSAMENTVQSVCRRTGKSTPLKLLRVISKIYMITSLQNTDTAGVRLGF